MASGHDAGNEQMNSRERVLAALDHQETDRIPIAMVCSGINEPARTAFEGLLRKTKGCSLAEYLDAACDIHILSPRYCGPGLQEGCDLWGVQRAIICQENGGSYAEIVRHPLAEATTCDELDRYPWPQPSWLDVGELPEITAEVRSRLGPRATLLGTCNPFETAWYLRGYEQSFMDLALGEEVFTRILHRVTDFYEEYIRQALEAVPGEIDLIFTADDIGGQQGLLMSGSMWEEHIKPHHERLNRTIHEYGAKVVYHSDGAIMKAVPGLVDMGIDVLQALQFDAVGMDPQALKDGWGDVLCFEGGVSVQSTLPFGSPQEVRAEVEERIAVLGREGGYILGPSHAIQAGTPPENICAMFETALRFRRDR